MSKAMANYVEAMIGELLNQHTTIKATSKSSIYVKTDFKTLLKKIKENLLYTQND